MCHGPGSFVSVFLVLVFVSIFHGDSCFVFFMFRLISCLIPRISRGVFFMFRGLNFVFNCISNCPLSCVPCG